MRLLFGIVLFCLTIHVALSDEKNEGWIFTPSVGVNRLNLATFFNTVYKAPFVGTVQITTDLPENVQGQNQYPVEPFFFKNDLKRSPVDVEAGLEMRRNFGRSNDFFIGINSWETYSASVPILITFPIQGARFNQANYTRQGKLSYTQFYVGIRNYLTPRSKPLSFYFNLGLHELYDVRYQEKDIFEFISGPPAGFKRIFVFKSSSTGILMMQFGIGAEYRIAEKFSVGIQGAYAFHIQDGFLRGVTVSDDTNNGDRIKSPPRVLDVINPSLDAGALDSQGVSHDKVYLRFDGWHALITFNIDFY